MDRESPPGLFTAFNSSSFPRELSIAKRYIIICFTKMKISTSTLLASSVASTNALWSGFNLGGNNLDGSCKTTADWAADFALIQSLPAPSGPYNVVRVYASSDCNTLANAVPAAINANMKILAGVWTEDATHFSNEKAALLAVAQQHGCDWLAAISTGSEDVYRGDADINNLAQQIYDVKGMMTTVSGCSVPIMHVDTWTAWAGNYGDMTPVITACDAIGTDGYPYFQSTQDNSIGNAYDEFWASVKAVEAVAQGKPVWITETGWPSSGPTYGNAVCSVENAESYWKSVGCKAFSTYHTLWFTLDDGTASPSFGIYSNGAPKYDITC